MNIYLAGSLINYGELSNNVGKYIVTNKEETVLLLLNSCFIPVIIWGQSVYWLYLSYIPKWFIHRSMWKKGDCCTVERFIFNGSNSLIQKGIGVI